MLKSYSSLKGFLTAKWGISGFCFCMVSLQLESYFSPMVGTCLISLVWFFSREQSTKYLWALKPLPHCIEVLWGWGKGFWSQLFLDLLRFLFLVACVHSSFWVSITVVRSEHSLLQAGGRILLWPCVTFAFCSKEIVYPGWVDQWSVMVFVSCQMPCGSDSPQARNAIEWQFLKLLSGKEAWVRNSYSIMIFRGHLILTIFQQHIWSTMNHDSSALKILALSSPVFWWRECDFCIL